MKATASNVRALSLAVTALAATATVAIAQPTAKRRPVPASLAATPVALQSDLVAVRVPPAAIIESWSEANPCTPHSHTHVSTLKVKRRQIGSPPATSAILYRNGQPVHSWALPTTSGTGEITLGTFTWTKPHPCGTTSYGPPPNYRLVVDPANLWQEASETNNAVDFYIDPAVPLVPSP